MQLTIRPLVFILCLVSSFCCFAQEGTQPKLLVVANNNSQLQYYENGEDKGPSIGILKAVLQEAELEASVEFMPWVRAFSIAKNKPNTLILSMIRTPEREADFHWIIKVSNLSRVFISLQNKPENYVDDMQQAKQKLIAIVQGSASYNELTTHGFSEQQNLYVVTDSELLVTLLESGRVDLLYDDPINIRSTLDKRGKRDLAIRYKTITPENERSSYIAINKASDIEIVNRLEQAARKYEKTAEYARFLIE
jgi:polar amino acid transport system substrate-binding protein